MYFKYLFYLVITYLKVKKNGDGKCLIATNLFKKYFAK